MSCLRTPLESDEQAYRLKALFSLKELLSGKTEDD
jgi:hypothetical protein